MSSIGSTAAGSMPCSTTPALAVTCALSSLWRSTPSGSPCAPIAVARRSRFAMAGSLNALINPVGAIADAVDPKDKDEKDTPATPAAAAPAPEAPQALSVNRTPKPGAVVLAGASPPFSHLHSVFPETRPFLARPCWANRRWLVTSRASGRHRPRPRRRMVKRTFRPRYSKRGARLVPAQQFTRRPRG